MDLIIKDVIISLLQSLSLSTGLIKVIREQEAKSKPFLRNFTLRVYTEFFFPPWRVEKHCSRTTGESRKLTM